MKRALIAVDIQNDFCPGGALAVPGGSDIIPVVNKLLEIIPVSVLTQDWHPAGHISFASTHGKPDYSIDDSEKNLGVLWPVHCVAGTHGADFHPALESFRGKLILRKGSTFDLDSYSAFFENDHCTSTGLAGWLREREIQQVIIAGLATDYCVLYTAMDSVRLGFATSIVIDAVRGVDASPGDAERALRTMEAAGCTLLLSNRIDK